ncbi:MAG: Type II secretion system protein F [Holosporales bacterium]
MHFFAYKARKHDGNTVKGYIFGAKKHEIYAILLQQNMQLLYVRAVHKLQYAHYSLNEKYEFCKMLFQSLSQLLKAQIPLLDAFKMMGEQTSKIFFKKIIYQMIYDLENGKSVCQAMQEHASFFGSVALQYVMVCEQNGNYEKGFDALHHYFNWILVQRSNIIKSIRYPLIILCFVIFLIFGFDTYLLPELISFLKMNQTESSSITLWLQIKNVAFDVFIFLIFCVCTFAFLNYKKMIPVKILKKAFYLPFGKMIFEKEWANFLHVLGLMLESQTPIKLAFSLAMNDVALNYLKADLQMAYTLLESGNTLTNALESVSYADHMTHRFLFLGEQSAKLDENLLLCSSIIYNRFYEKIEKIIHILQPAFMLSIGFLILFIIHVFVLPIYDVLSTVGES